MAVETVRDTQEEKILERALEVFRVAAEEAYKVRGVVIVALPGGRSIMGFLKYLLAKQNTIAKDIWKSFRFFLVDERLVPNDDEQSNFRLLSENFYQPLEEKGLISSEQFFPFVREGMNREERLKRYRRTLENFGGNFDITLLGVGEDGHVAGLFPHHLSLAHSGDFFLVYEESPKPPNGRMTSSRRLLQRSSCLMLFFLGEAKRPALEAYLNSEVAIEDCPAKIVDEVRAGYIFSDLA